MCFKRWTKSIWLGVLFSFLLKYIPPLSSEEPIGSFLLVAINIMNISTSFLIKYEYYDIPDTDKFTSATSNTSNDDEAIWYWTIRHQPSIQELKTWLSIFVQTVVVHINQIWNMSQYHEEDLENESWGSQFWPIFDSNLVQPEQAWLAQR